MIENNYLGRKYPFFFNNYDLTDSHYLYEIYSPSMCEKTGNLLISLDKISEKTRGFVTYGKGTDLITMCLRSDDGKEKLSPEDYLIEMLTKKDELCCKTNVYQNVNNNFPLIEIVEDGFDKNEIQKIIIENLRDTVRWKYYKFYFGRYIDVLWTKDEFMVFKLECDKTTVRLVPKNIYKNIDVMLTNPLPPDKLENESDFTWTREDFKIGDLGRLIKKCEWNSFDKNSLY